MGKLAVALVSAGLVFAPAFSYADSFAERCPDIASCARVISQMLDQKYVFDTDVNGKMEATGNLELTKENAEWLFTNMLFANGFTRMPIGNNTYRIARVRDAKDLTIPLYEASKQVAPSLPDNWDYATMRYKAANPEVVEHIARMVRDFMPPNSRIISSDLDGTLLVTDTNPNLRKMYGIVRNLDEKPTSQLRRKWEEEEKERRAERLMQKHDEKHSPAPSSSGKSQ